MTQPTRRPVYASRKFQTMAGKTYYVCVDNGAADGSHRSGQVMVTVDNGIVLTPADFKPEKDPPRHVAVALQLDRTHGRSHDTVPPPAGKHEWDAALFGQGGTITVSIRVAK